MASEGTCAPMSRFLVLPIALALSSTAILAQLPVPAAGRSLVGSVVDYVVKPGDSLTSIAARFGVDVSTIARRNGRPAGVPLKPGTALVLDARHIVPSRTDRPLVINIPQRELFVFRPDNRVEAFPLGLGRPDWRTPTGRFTVIVKERQPTWNVPLSIQEEMRRAGKTPLVTVPPGPDNPLGDYWLGLSLPGVGIHDTNAPSSVYTFATHGCIRVHPERIALLFDLVQTGTAGEIIYEPALMTAQDGRVFVEVHRDVYGKGIDASAALRSVAERAGFTSRIDWERVAEAVRLREGIAIDVSAE